MFSSLDIYGKQISFGIDGRSSFQTNLGSFITLVTLALTIFCCLLFGSDLYYKENPSVVDQTSQPLETTPLYFKPENYTMVFSFGDDYFNFDPTGFFTISISYEFIDNFNANKTTSQMTMRNCTEYDMRNYLGLFKQGHFLCLNIAEFVLKGSWTENYLSRIKISVNRCRNSTLSPIVCKPDEVISKKIQDDVYFNIYAEDKSVNTDDFDSPFTNYIKDLYWLLDNKLGKHVEVFLKKVTISTDSGSVLSSTSSDFVHKFEHYDLDVVSNENIVNRTYPLMKLVLYASSHTQLIQRVYPKVQFVAAEVSGIVKIFSMVCMVLLSFYTKYALTIFLINSEFDNTRKPKKKTTNFSRRSFPQIGREPTQMISKPQEVNSCHPSEELRKPPRFKKFIVQNHSEGDYTESVEERGATDRKLIQNCFDNNLMEMGETNKYTPSPTNNPEENIMLKLRKTAEKTKEKNNSLSFGDTILHIDLSKAKDPIRSNNEDSIPLGRAMSSRKILMPNSLSRFELAWQKSRKRLPEKTDLDGLNLSTPRSRGLDSPKSQDVKANIWQKIQKQNKRRSFFSRNTNVDEKNLGFKFTFWDYIVAKCCWGCCLRKKLRNKKSKMFQKATIAISSYFDARLLIRKIIDIERMKKLLLTEEQLKVYEFLTKPKLFYEKEEKGTSFTIKDMGLGFKKMTEKKLQEKIECVESFYRRIFNENNPNQIDKALYYMMDEDLREGIEDGNAMGSQGLVRIEN